MSESVAKEVRQELAPQEMQLSNSFLLFHKNFSWGVGGEFHHKKSRDKICTTTFIKYVNNSNLESEIFFFYFYDKTKIF